jgi:hypothetical protein
VTSSPGRPRILEVKRTVAGREQRFACEVLERRGDHLVVLFVSPDVMRVHDVELPAGTVTFGHFWRARPYNVYHWLRPRDGTTIGVYANLCDETAFDVDTLTWLDLVVDVLVLPGQPPVILDENELPEDASTALRMRIARAQAELLNGLPALLDELEETRVTLWPTVAGKRAVS